MSSEYISQTKDGVLPNITGTLSHSRLSKDSAGYTGAFTGSEYSPFNFANNISTASDISITYNFDASRCSSLYNNNDWYSGTKVIPSCIAMYYIIKY